MWPLHSAFLLFILCRIFLTSLTLSSTFSFLTPSLQLVFSILLQTSLVLLIYFPKCRCFNQLITNHNSEKMTLLRQTFAFFCCLFYSIDIKVCNLYGILGLGKSISYYKWLQIPLTTKQNILHRLSWPQAYKSILYKHRNLTVDHIGNTRNWTWRDTQNLNSFLGVVCTVISQPLFLSSGLRNEKIFHKQVAALNAGRYICFRSKHKWCSYGTVWRVLLRWRNVCWYLLYVIFYVCL